VAAGLLIAMVLSVSVFDLQIHYSNLPVEVKLIESEEGDLISPIHGEPSLPVVGFGDLRVRANDKQGFVLAILEPFMLVVELNWIVSMLRRFLANIKSGNLFIRENPKLILRIGWLVTIIGTATGTLRYIQGKIYLSMIKIPGASIEADKNYYVISIVAGLIILVLSQVYDSALRIKNDTDLTI
jgi:hypothetical protein